MKKRVGLNRLFGLVVFCVIISSLNLAIAEDVAIDVSKITLSSEKNNSNSNFKDKSNEILDKDVQIPEELNVAARVLFGVKSNISLSQFIVLSCLWVLFFIFVLNVIGFIPFFEGRWKANTVAFIICLLVANSGGILTASNLFHGFFGLKGTQQEWVVFKLILLIVILIVMGFVIFKILRILKERYKEEGIEILGFKLGVK